MLSDHIFRAYDIRGIVGEDFDEDGVRLIAKGYASYLYHKNTHRDEPLTVAVGRDGRLSGEAFHSAFVEGLLESGINVVSIGLSTSPLLYFSVCIGGFDGGAMITASHNPAEYNGFKLQGCGASSICGEELQKILTLIHEKDFIQGEGSFSTQSFIEPYYNTLEEITHFPHSNWSIAIDCGNGVPGKYNPEFFRRQGFTVHELYCDIDGRFPNHDADPEQAENLNDLKKLVVEKSCDFGLAFDGDGDRVGVIDKNGNHFSADLLLLLLAREMLSRPENEGSAIVYDLKATELLKEEIEHHGGKPVMCKTGHSFVEEAMEDHNAILGGEVSGHIFIAEKYFGFDDALLASAKLLEIAIHSKESFTEILDALPKTFITPEKKIPVPEHQKFETMEKVKTALLEQYPDALTIDGVRIDFGEGSWGIVRASNTSPYLTTRFEARTQDKLTSIQKIFLEIIENIIQNI